MNDHHDSDEEEDHYHRTTTDAAEFHFQYSFDLQQLESGHLQV